MGLDMVTRCKVFHGTDTHSKEKIIKEQHFIESSRDDEWAGTGVYFFIDSNENVAELNAYNWAKNFKDIPIYNIGILFAEIEYNNEEILDLTNDQDLQVFQEYRRICFERAAKIAKEKNKQLSTKYNNASKFDCYVINTICSKLLYKIVKKHAYISKLEKTYFGVDMPKSFIPNCTIAAVRDQRIIRKIGETDGQKTFKTSEIAH